MKENIFYKD